MRSFLTRGSSAALLVVLAASVILGGQQTGGGGVTPGGGRGSATSAGSINAALAYPNKLCVQSVCTYASIAEFGDFDAGQAGTYVSTANPAFNAGVSLYPSFNYPGTMTSIFGLDVEPVLHGNANQTLFIGAYVSPTWLGAGRTLADFVGIYTASDDGSVGAVTKSSGIWIDNRVSGATNYSYRSSQSGATNFAYYVDGDSPSRFNAIQGQYVSRGTAPTVANVAANSCGTTAATVNATSTSNAGEITVGATSGTQCRLTFAAAAPNAWACSATNNTTAALARGVRVDTTHADLMGAFVAGDVISYQCTPR